MAKWAHIVDGIVVEVTDIDPRGRFHPSMIWIDCPDTVNQRWTYDGAAFAAPPTPSEPPPDFEQILANRVNAGILITSTSNPELNATYSMDTETMVEIGSVARDAASGMGLPGDGPTFTYQSRSFTEEQITACYKAMRNLLWVLNAQAAIMANGGTPTWPTQTATIP